MNWNTAAAAKASASAFLASEGLVPRVTIVDNASVPEERLRLREDLPGDTRLLLADHNMGYAAAAHAVLDHSDADAVCVSNADVVPAPRMLAALTQAVMEDDRIGVAAPTFSDSDDDYHAKLPAAVALLVRPFVGSFGQRPAASVSEGEVRIVEQPAGACLVLRASIWRRFGGLDPGFFLWYEDVDLAKRLHEAGLRNVVLGAARASHTGASAFVQMDRRTQQAIRLRSLRRYIRRHHRLLLPIAQPLIALAWLARVRPLRLRRWPPLRNPPLP